MSSGDKVKILYVHHSGNLGGAPRSLSFLLDRLDFSLCKVDLLCIADGPGIQIFRGRPIRILMNQKIYPFHGSTVSGSSLKILVRNILRAPQSFIEARKSIKQNMPDLIHLNSSCLFVVALAAKSINKDIKIICHVREPLLKNSISAGLMRYFNYKLIDRFIAIDEFSAGTMRSKKSIPVIYNSVNFSDFNTSFHSQKLRLELGLDSEAIIFLYLARFSESNGTLPLVEAAEKLIQDYPNFHFVIAGYKTEYIDSYTSKILRLFQNKKQIHIMPFRTDVREMIASSDILVVPFTKPHFARSIVEASALGKPSIGNDVGGVNELIDNEVTGLLYHDESELMKHCISLGTNWRLREELGRNASNFARNNFDNVVNSEKIFEVYRQLIGRKV